MTGNDYSEDFHNDGKMKLSIDLGCEKEGWDQEQNGNALEKKQRKTDYSSNINRMRPLRPQHCWDQTEYFEESWRPKEICCHSDFMCKTHLHR